MVRSVAGVTFPSQPRVMVVWRILISLAFFFFGQSESSLWRNDGGILVFGHVTTFPRPQSEIESPLDKKLLLVEKLEKREPECQVSSPKEKQISDDDPFVLPSSFLQRRIGLRGLSFSTENTANEPDSRGDSRSAETSASDASDESESEQESEAGDSAKVLMTESEQLEWAAFVKAFEETLGSEQDPFSETPESDEVLSKWKLHVLSKSEGDERVGFALLLLEFLFLGQYAGEKLPRAHYQGMQLLVEFITEDFTPQERETLESRPVVLLVNNII